MKIVRSSLIPVHVEEGDERIYLRLHKTVHEALKRGEMFHLKSGENDHSMAEAVKFFKSQLDGNEENYAFLKILRPHCESLLKHMVSGFRSDQSTFIERFIPFVGLDIVNDWLFNLASIYRKHSYFFFAKDVVDFASNLLENINETISGAFMKARIFDISGIVYRDIGEYNQAKELHIKALMINQKTFSEDPAFDNDNLASVCNSLGEYDQAKEFHEKALTIYKKIFGEDHGSVATSYNNLALVYEGLGEYNQAKDFHEKALMILKRISGEDHASVATSYGILASVCNCMGEYNQAKELHEKALTICQKNFGEDHTDVATSYNNLALVHENLGEYNQAKDLHENALMI